MYNSQISEMKKMQISTLKLILPICAFFGTYRCDTDTLPIDEATTPVFTSRATEGPLPTEGCLVCSGYSSNRCPSDPSECVLGTVPDYCGCCDNGVCAKLEGELCWDPDISELPKERRIDGACAKNYECLLRQDLGPQDQPEATCVCLEPGQACGTNNQTYKTVCALQEEMARSKDEDLKLAYSGPCPSRPRIYSAPDDFNDVDLGQIISINCEVKGFPLPDINWEFRSNDGSKVLRLPHDDLLDNGVSTSDNLEESMRSSWLQLEHVEKEHVGTYYCIANNSLGEASAYSVVSFR